MRVVTLLPAGTDVVCALGGADMLVGVTHECDHGGIPHDVRRVTSSDLDGAAAPAQIDRAVRDRHSSGTPLFRLDESAIANARPDLIITQALCEVCAVRESDVRALAGRLDPAPVVLTLGARTLDEVLLDISRVARAIGLDDEGDELIAGLRSRLRTVHTTLKSVAAPRPLVAVIEWTDPVFIAGHWVPEMVKRAGGLDVLATAGEHSIERPSRAVQDASPEVVLVAPCGYGVERAADAGRALLALPSWQWMRERHVWALDASRLTSRPSPNLVDGVEVMARIFNPSLFTPLDSRDAAKLT